MKIEREKRVLERMIRIYCSFSEKNSELCDGCRELLAYANERLDKCPFGDGKGSCKGCKIHCYKPEMRARIRRVMRFSGPRMLFISPIMSLRHLK